MHTASEHRRRMFLQDSSISSSLFFSFPLICLLIFCFSFHIFIIPSTQFLSYPSTACSFAHFIPLFKSSNFLQFSSKLGNGFHNYVSSPSVSHSSRFLLCSTFCTDFHNFVILREGETRNDWVYMELSTLERLTIKSGSGLRIIQLKRNEEGGGGGGEG